MSAIGEGAICKYFGSKLTSSRHYPAPTDDEAIIEPFAGGAGYSLRHWARSDGSLRQVLLVELDPAMAGLWRWLISADEGEILRLPVEMPVGADIREILGEGPQADLVARWQRVGAFRGTAGGYKVSTWNGKPGLWGERTRERVAAGLHRIRGWRCIHGSYDECSSTGIGPALVFADPPYQHYSPRLYSGASDPLDYGRLAAWCRAMGESGNRVVVCEAQGKVRGIDREPDWLPFVDLGVITPAGGARGGDSGPSVRRRITERVWTSWGWEPPIRQQQLDLLQPSE